MPIPPTIDVSQDWLFFDNQQPVTLRNDGDNFVKVVPYALQEGVDTVMTDYGDGTIGYRTFCIWHVWRDVIEPFVPQINCILKDKNNTEWYVSNVRLDVWGNKYLLDCEAKAGTGVVPIKLPYIYPTSTTSTTSTSTTSSTSTSPIPTSTTSTTSTSSTTTSPVPTTTSTTTTSSTTTLAPLVVLPLTLNDGTQGIFYSVQFTVS